MLKLFYLLFFLSSYAFTQSQTLDGSFYKIEYLGNKYSSIDVDNALENANMCGYFYANTKRKMIFDDGTVVLLNSSNEDSTLDNNCVVSKNQDDTKEYWEISQSGHLIRRIKQITKQ